MAESPASQVYSPGILGDAVLLGSGLGPLTVLRQEAAARARAKAAAAKLKQQQEDSDARNFVPVTADGWGVHNEQLSNLVQEKLALNKADYQNDGLTLYEKKSRSFGRANEAKQAADASNEMKANYAATMAKAGAEKRYDTTKVDKAFMDTLYNLDPETGARTTAIPIPQVDIRKQQDVLDGTNVLNKGQVYQTFIKGLADEENVRIGKAALPGGFGNTTVFDSNIFAHDKDGNPVYNADRSSKIANMPRLLARMQDDPFVRKVLQQDAIDNQRAAGSQQMMSGSPQMDGYSQLSPAQNAQMQALPTAGAQQTQVNSATDIARYGKTKTSSVDSFRPMPRPPRPAALKANDGQAFETSGFTLNAPTQDVQVPVLTPNPAPAGGLGKFLQPSTGSNVTKQQPYTSHFFSTGHSFATSKNGFVTASVPSNGLTVLGSDGTANAYSGDKANSQVPMQVNGRQLVVELRGKLLGTAGDGTGKDAEQEANRIIDALPEADAKEARARIVYLGSVTDKPKTSGDGSGSTAKIIGYKDGNGTAIPDAMVPAMEKAGMKLFAQYDQTTTMSKAKQYASREVDAQLMRLNKGYNPAQLTPSQARIIQRLRSRGGDFISPYQTERQPAAPVTPPANVTGSGYQRPAASQPAKKVNATNGAARGGAVYKSK